jgi:prepilin-type N-terminal cleavage/methylation domain-containing protein
MPYWTRNKTGFTQPLHAGAGFTMVELLVVTAIVSVVSLAAYSVLDNGVKVWKKANTVLALEDLALFFDRFSRDVRNTIRFESIGFAGEAHRIEFASLVNSRGLGGRCVGKIIYQYLPQERLLRRAQADFSQIYNTEEEFTGQGLKEITSLKFSYYYYDKEKKGFFWSDNWLSKALPLAIRVELEFVDKAGNGSFTRTVSIPVSDKNEAEGCPAGLAY